MLVTVMNKLRFRKSVINVKKMQFYITAVFI